MQLEKLPSLPGRIVAELRRQTREGKLRWGDRLPTEGEMGERFGVSRSSVREAVRVLEFLGLVQVVQGRGTFLTTNPYRLALEPLRWSPLSDTDLCSQALEVRMLLEPAMARLAAQRADEGTIARMERDVNQSLADAQAGRPHNMALSIDFHQAIAEGAGNLLLQMMFQAMHELVVVVVRRLDRSPEQRRSRQMFHRALLDAVRSHDPDGAERAMREHIANLRASVQALAEEDARFRADEAVEVVP